MACGAVREEALGLVGMRERALSIGAKLHIASLCGAGVIIRMDVAHTKL